MTYKFIFYIYIFNYAHLHQDLYLHVHKNTTRVYDLKASGTHIE